MANSLTQNPIVIDSVMSSGYKASVAAALGSPISLLVDKINWSGVVGTTDVLSIVDPDNNNVLLEIANKVAGATWWVDWTSRPKLWRDFKVAAIGSGTLYIFTR